VAALLDRLRAGLSRTRQGLGLAERVDWDELEEALVLADVGAAAAAEIVTEARGTETGQARRNVVQALAKRLETDERRARLRRLGFTPDARRTAAQPQGKVLLIVGVNGAGKTTTAAKLAARFRDSGMSVLLGAADTFRAAGASQLAAWAGRLGLEVVEGAHGADPAAVAYDAARARAARGQDLLIVDTAGRLHTRHNLMEELRKIQRSIEKAEPGEPKDVWLVMDGTTGQNGLVQARAFNESLGLTGVVVTKLDGTARGGILVQIVATLGVRVVYVGVGEGADDLQPFDALEYAEAMVQ
jgi:fused signal recognition particle receptor